MTIGGVEIKRGEGYGTAAGTPATHDSSKRRMCSAALSALDQMHRHILAQCRRLTSRRHFFAGLVLADPSTVSMLGARSAHGNGWAQRQAGAGMHDGAPARGPTLPLRRALSGSAVSSSVRDTASSLPSADSRSHKANSHPQPARLRMRAPRSVAALTKNPPDRRVLRIHRHHVREPTARATT